VDGRVLITGKTGFIGGHTANAFAKLNYRVISFVGDVTKEEDWQKNLSFEVDCIVHIAGVRTESKHDFEINTVAAESLARTVRRIVKKPPAIIFTSTQAVYLGQRTPFREDMPVKPPTKYAQSKVEAEKIIMQLGRENLMRVVILRLSAVLGSGIRPESKMSGPLEKWTKAALKNEPILVFQDGSQTRDYIHVNDVVSAILLAAEEEKMAGIFNVGGGKRIKLSTLAQWIKKETASKSQIIIRGNYPSLTDPHDLFSDLSSIRKFGWKPLRSPKEAVREYIACFLDGD